MFGLNKVTGRGRQTVEALKQYTDGTVSTKTDTFDYTGNPEGTINHSVTVGSKVKKMCYISMTGTNNIDGIFGDYRIKLGATHIYTGLFLEPSVVYPTYFLIEWINGIVKVWRNTQDSETGTTVTTLVDVYSTGMNCINEPLTIDYTGSHDPESTSTVKIETTIIYN